MLPYRKTPRTEQDARLDPGMSGVWLESRNKWHAVAPLLTLFGLVVAALGMAAFIFWGASLAATLAH